jgi:hypothetical protein
MSPYDARLVASRCEGYQGNSRCAYAEVLGIRIRKVTRQNGSGIHSNPLVRKIYIMAVLRNLQADAAAELAALREENARLKSYTGLRFKMGNKGNICVLGLQAFPVTLYRAQWERILDNADALRAFIADHADECSSK